MRKYIFFDRFRCFLSGMAEIDAFGLQESQQRSEQLG